MKGKILLLALMAASFLVPSAYAAPSFKQSGDKLTIREGVDDAILAQLKTGVNSANKSKLALSVYKITDEDLKKICAEAPGVVSLTIDSKLLTSIAPLADLKNLKKLSLITEKVSDFTPLSGLTEIDDLYASSDAMAPDLKWMSGMTKITKLVVSGGPNLTSLEGIPSLPNLRFARFSHAAAADLTPILALPALTNLELTYCTLGDMSPLAKLANLSFLSLYGANVKDFSSLAGCAKLKTLMYYATKDADYSTLGTLTQLEELKGGLTKLNDISWVVNLPNLKKFDLFAEYVTDYSPLVKTNVQKMQIWNMNVPVDLKSLAGVTSLKELKLWSLKDVTGFEALGTLTGLEQLIFSSVNEKDGIIDLSFMKNLKNLKKVEFSSMNAVNTSAMEGLALSRIEGSKINLAGGKPFDLAFLAKMPDLQTLSINNANISNLDAIANAPNLSSVTLTKVNGAPSLAPLQKMPMLKRLNISKGVYPDAEKSGFKDGVKINER